MATTVTLNGISEDFTADEIECLVRTAGEALHGNVEDLSERQTSLAARAYDLYMEDLNADML